MTSLESCWWNFHSTPNKMYCLTTTGFVFPGSLSRKSLALNRSAHFSLQSNFSHIMSHIHVDKILLTLIIASTFYSFILLALKFILLFSGQAGQRCPVRDGVVCIQAPRSGNFPSFRRSTGPTSR